MGRWTQYDEDSYRLPEGMKRVGYDADSGKYYFRDQDGSLWEGAAGVQFGEMKQVDSAPIALDEAHEDDGDLEAAGVRADGYQPVASDESGMFGHLPRLSNNSPWRTMFPFLMIVIVVLLLVWRLVFQSSHEGPPDAAFCSGGTHPYRVQTGDTCWDISQTRGFSLEDLLKVNQGLACDTLTPGQIICLPPPQD